MKPRSTRLAAAFLTAVLVALTSTACSFKPYGEHSCNQVGEIALQSGLFIDAGMCSSGPDGFPPKYGLHVFATLAPGVDSPAEVKAALDYLLRLAWAQTSNSPTDSSDSWVSLGRYDREPVDLVSILRELSGNDHSIDSWILSDANPNDHINWPRLLTSMYGNWPGPIPQVPDGLRPFAERTCAWEAQPTDLGNALQHGARTCEQFARSPIASDVFDKVHIYVSNDTPSGKTDLVINAELDSDLRRYIKMEHYYRPDSGAEMLLVVLDYLLRLGWSQTGVTIDGQVELMWRGCSGCWDTASPALREILGDGVPDESSYPPETCRSASFSYSYLEQIYGPSPGPTPDVPEALSELMAKSAVFPTPDATARPTTTPSP